MKAYTDILQQIKNKKFAPVYFLEGEEPYYIDKLVKVFEEGVLTPEERDFNLIELYGKDIEIQEVISNARRYPMFAEYLLVIVREASQLKNIDALEGYLSNPSPNTILVLEYRFKKLDKRGKLSKALKQNAEVFTSEKIKEQEMPGWIMAYGREKNITIEPNVAEMLAVYLGNDLQKVVNEIDKVLINEPNLTELTTTLIEQYIGISKEYNVLDLPIVVFTKDYNRLARMMAYFSAQPKNAPMAMVIGLFYSYINKLYLCFYAPQNFDSDKKLGIWSTHRQVAGQYTLPKIHQAIALLERYNHKSRGIDSHGNDTSLLKEFIGHLQLIIK